MRPITFLLTLLAIAPQVSAAVDFAHEVVPILKKHCVECHGGEKSKGGLSMNTRALLLEADVLVLGDPKASLMIEVLTAEDPDDRMPPLKKKKAALNPAEIAVLERWIAEDVPWEEGFTFAADRYEPPLKPRAVKVPPGPADANPIDLIVAKHFKDKGIDFPAPADDATFLRRVSEDLIGLPPTTEAVTAIAKGDSLDRRKVVDALLADEQGYAEHWLTYWNDLLRNDYGGTGFITGGRKQITAWLYPALLKNKPFDEFVRELVAPGPESRGFIEGIQWRGEVNASQTTQIQFSQNVSQVFLGINMKCASCHDSFIDRWTLKEAYGLAAIYSETPLELERCDKPTGEMAKAAWLFPELGEIDATKPRDERLKQLAGLITHPENGRTQRTIANRLWSQMMGRGIVHPVDAMNTAPWSEELKAFTTGGFFGSEFGPMNLPFPELASQAVKPPGGMSPDRFKRRYKALEDLLKNSPKSEQLSDYHQESMLRSLDNAHRLLGSKEREAFDLTKEKKEVFDEYNTGKFGQGCLLARRLVENGARFVEVTTEYVPFLNWDTHENGHTTADQMHKEIDRPIARLIKDLEERGLLDRTLVIIASEFSRDMLIEGVPGSTAKDQSRAKTDVIKEMKQYGLHRHFTGGSSVVMFGGGMKKGYLHGATADERPCMAIEKPVSIEDLHATIFTAMGISPKTEFDIESRPFYATKDGVGKAVRDVFA